MMTDEMLSFVESGRDVLLQLNEKAVDLEQLKVAMKVGEAVLAVTEFGLHRD